MRGVNLVRVGRKWMFRTADDLSWLLTKETVETRKLSRAAIETLAIIAYHQPVTRAEIEEIRGVVAAAGTLDVLLRTDWIRPRGRRKAPGRPITYGTTEQFLTHFGLEEVGDLPGLDELKGAGLLEGNLPPGFAVPLPSDDIDAARRRRPARSRRSRPRPGAAVLAKRIAASIRIILRSPPKFWQRWPSRRMGGLMLRAAQLRCAPQHEAERVRGVVNARDGLTPRN